MQASRYRRTMFFRGTCPPGAVPLGAEGLEPGPDARLGLGSGAPDCGPVDRLIPVAGRPVP